MTAEARPSGNCSCLEAIDVDPETGESSTHESEYADGVPLDEILDRAKFEDDSEQLRQKGGVYEPQQNHLQTT